MLEITLICDKCEKSVTVDLPTVQMGLPTYDHNIITAMNTSGFVYERLSNKAPFIVCSDCDKDFKKIKQKHNKEAKGFFKKV